MDNGATIQISPELHLLKLPFQEQSLILALLNTPNNKKTKSPLDYRNYYTSFLKLSAVKTFPML